jgi:hypothetical protein
MDYELAGNPAGVKRPGFLLPDFESFAIVLEAGFSVLVAV